MKPITALLIVLVLLTATWKLIGFAPTVLAALACIFVNTAINE